MKTKEEVETILNDSSNDLKDKMIDIVLGHKFTQEELACILVAVVASTMPNMTAHSMQMYCSAMKVSFAETQQELDQLN